MGERVREFAGFDPITDKLPLILEGIVKKLICVDFLARPLCAVSMKRALKQSICRLNQLLGKFDEPLFILGDGRSGTTWMQEILNFDNRFREMFEPFNGMKQMDLKYNSHYPSPEVVNRRYVRAHCDGTLRGDFVNITTSRTIHRLIYEGLVIKDISSHLILDQLFDAESKHRRVMLLRHPFAVALSKTKRFLWPTVPELFLQFESSKTILKSYLPFIENCEDPLLNHVIVWCIIHKIAFASKAIQSFNFIFYEEFVYNPEENASKLFEAFGQMDRYRKNEAAIIQVATRKSKVTNEDNAIRESQRGRSKWMDEWPEETIQAGIEIMEAFELDFLYGNEHFPKISTEELKERLSGTSGNEWSAGSYPLSRKIGLGLKTGLLPSEIDQRIWNRG